MCGRFVASRPVSELAELLDAAEIDPTPPEQALVGDGGIPPPRWNVAPQAAVWALTVGKRRLTSRAGADGAGGDGTGANAARGDAAPVRRLAQYRWGLVPSWAKDPTVGARMFNARGDTVADKPAYRTALARRRCIIPADAFYEWGAATDPEGGGTGSAVGLPGIDTGSAPVTASGRKARPRKQPWCFRRADGGILAFAGLWEAWKPRLATADTADTAADNETVASEGTMPGDSAHRELAAEVRAHSGWLRTCTIITTSANELVSGVHDRMPVILPTDAWGEWLGPEELAPADLRGFLAPAPSGVLISYKVADLVSNSRSEGPELAQPVAAAPGESSRFAGA